MTWSTDFQSKLASGNFEPIVAVHILKWAGTPGRESWFISAPGYGMPEVVGARLVMTGSSINPTTWNYTHGTCSIEISTDDIGGICQQARRGALCQVLVGFAGWDISEFEPVFVGRVQNIRGIAPNYVIDLWDGTSVLNSRLGTFTSFQANQSNLFHNVSSTDSTTLTSAYTPGDSTVDVTSAAVLEMPTNSAVYPGVVYVDNGSDDPFFLTYTGKSGNQLTGVSTSNVLGTTQVTANPASSTVYNAAYLQDMPGQIFLRILTSGSGASIYDVYPESWGYGLPLKLCDESDVINVSLAMVAAAGSGSYGIAYGQRESVTDSWSWLSEWFIDLGLVPVQRHGLITLRPIQDPNDPLLDSGLSITDEDIVELQEWGAYHPDQQVEYIQVRVTGDGLAVATSASTPETNPTDGRLTYDNTDKLFAFVSANINEIKARVGVWGPNIPEYIMIRCAGMRLATLAPLDVVRVSSARLPSGRINSTYLAGYDSQPCMVLSVSPDFYLGEVTLTLAAVDPL